MNLIRKGDSGPGVGAVQQMLVEANYSVPAAELSGSVFGDGTYEAVRAFQASHLGPDHHPLSEDGVVGEQTWWALQHPGGDGGGRFTAPGWRCDVSQVRSEARRVIEIAFGEIGVCEDPDGSNDGPRVRIYTAPDFIGSPWCALFASWCLQRGSDYGSPFGRIASTWGIYEWALKNGRVLSASDESLPGDLFLILRGDASDPKRHGHTGFVCGPSDVDGRFATIAGNESNSVRGSFRKRSDVSAIVRVIPVV